MKRLLPLTLAAVAGILGAAAPSAGAEVYPPGFFEETIVDGLTRPTQAAWAPDGRMFVIQKDGLLLVVEPNTETAIPIKDYAPRVNGNGDRGLLGLALDAEFDDNGFIYLLYTADSTAGGDTGGAMVSKLLRGRVVPTTSGSPPYAVVDETLILGTSSSAPCPAPSNTLDCIPSDGLSHSIGSVRAAPDGTLFVGSGDAASYSFVDPVALRTYNEQSLAGKILHIDRNGRGLPGHPFCPGADLGFVCAKLHSKGFRNPYRFALRPNGGVTVGDVGWYTREEVDLLPPGGGLSYGWPCYEGNGRTPGYQDLAACQAQYAIVPNPHTNANHSYNRGGVDSAAVGGPTYTGSLYPAGYANDVFFGDYAQGFIRKLNVNASDVVTSVDDFVTDWGGVSLEEAPNGDLVYVTMGNFGTGQGAVRRVVYSTGNRPPNASLQAFPRFGAAPLEVQFDAEGSTDPDGDPLLYSWDFGDGTPPTDLEPEAAQSHTYDDPGTYTATLTVSDGRDGSDTASVPISAGNGPPVITLESGDVSYRGGEPFGLEASAEDPQDGVLPPSRFEWNVLLNHSDHVHPFGNYPDTDSVSVVAASDHDADSFYEVTLSVTDLDGLRAERTFELRPETVNLRLDSSPPGAPLSYGGRNLFAPAGLVTAIGFRPSVSAAQSFVREGRIYEFASWSDGGARLHDLTVPAVNRTLTAFYREAGTAPVPGPPLVPDLPGAGLDRTGPRLRLRSVQPRRGRLTGLAIDSGGVRRVALALRRRLPEGGCSWWLAGRGRMSETARRCERPRWIGAGLRRLQSGTRWTVDLGTPLPPGGYRVLVRGLDRAGNESRLRVSRATLVRVRP